MHLDHILMNALRYNVAFAAAWGANFFAKHYVTKARTSATPRRLERVKLFAICVFSLALVGFFFALGHNGNGDDDSDPMSTSASRGALVFFGLLIPVLLGANEGMETTDPEILRDHPPSNTQDW